MQQGFRRSATAVRKGLSNRPVLTGCLLVALVAGILLRCWIAYSSLGDLDSDEAVVGLMARHIADGGSPIFYWGQQYGGSQEAYLAAPGLAVAPGSVAALKMVPLMLHLVGVWVCYLIGCRVASRETGLFAAALFWIWPGYFVWWSLKERGFYGIALVAGLTVWLMALHIDQTPGRRHWVLLGFAAGMGWWASPQIVFLLVPPLVWLASRRRLSFGGGALALVSAVAGAFPWLYANLQTGFASFVIPPVPVADNRYLLRLQSFFVEALPVVAGLQLERLHWFLDPLGLIAFAVALGALTVVLLLRSHLLLAIAVLGYPFLYAISPLSQGEARYLYLLGPVLVLVVAVAVRSDLVRVTVVLTGIVLSGGSLAAMDRHLTSTPGAPDVPIPGDLRVVAEELEEAGVESVYADYWIAYPVVFFSDERVIATPFRGQVRSEGYDDFVRGSAGARYLLPAGSVTVEMVRNAFVTSGGAFEETALGPFVLIGGQAALTPEAIPGLQSPDLDMRRGS